MLTMQTGQVFAAEPGRISPWDSQPSAALAASTDTLGQQSVVGVCGTFSCIWGLTDSVQMSLFSSCCSEVLLMPAATCCCKRQKFLGSLVQQFPYHKQRATDKKILRACLSVPVNMKICYAPPTVRKGSGIIHWILVLPATQSIVLSYFVLFHVKVFTGKLPDCNWNVKVPAGNTFYCSYCCRMALCGSSAAHLQNVGSTFITHTKKSHHLLILHSQYLHHVDFTAPALWKVQTIKLNNPRTYQLFQRTAEFHS